MSPQEPAETDSLQAGLRGLCPRCGAGGLFASWIRFADKCRGCGLDFSSFNVGDGPAAFLILVVGAITVAAALIVDGCFSPPWWVHLIWIPFAAGLTIGGLRMAKGWLLAQEYKHRAREGRVAR